MGWPSKGQLGPDPHPEALDESRKSACPRVRGCENPAFGKPWFFGDRYDWTTGAPDNGNDWRKFRALPRLDPIASPYFVLCLIGVETEGLLDYQGRGTFLLYGGTFARLSDTRHFRRFRGSEDQNPCFFLWLECKFVIFAIFVKIPCFRQGSKPRFPKNTRFNNPNSITQKVFIKAKKAHKQKETSEKD